LLRDGLGEGETSDKAKQKNKNITTHAAIQHKEVLFNMKPVCCHL